MAIPQIRETVFEHEEGRDTATITAAELWSKVQLLKLKALYPDEVDVYENKDGSVFGHVPWKWMRLVPPRKKVEMSEAQLKALEEGRNRRSKK